MLKTGGGPLFWRVETAVFRVTLDVGSMDFWM